MLPRIYLFSCLLIHRLLKFMSINDYKGIYKTINSLYSMYEELDQMARKIVDKFQKEKCEHNKKGYPANLPFIIVPKDVAAGFEWIKEPQE